MHGRRRSVTQTNKNVFYLERRGATMGASYFETVAGFSVTRLTERGLGLDRPDRQTEPSGKRRYRRHPKPECVPFALTPTLSRPRLTWLVRSPNAPVRQSALLLDPSYR